MLLIDVHGSKKHLP